MKANYVRPRVYLYQSTPDMLSSILAACRVCRSEVGIPDRIGNEEIGPAQQAMIRRVLKSGHTSVLEHISFTFAVSGMSLAARSQLFRHRIASYTEQSKRAVDASKVATVLPPSIAENTQAGQVYHQLVTAAHEAYCKLVDLGVPMEDARYVMPVATETHFLVTYNGRELFDSVFPDRMCMRAQWEVREVVGYMYQIAMSKLPSVYKLTGPRCHNDKCSEIEKCMRKVGGND